MNFALFWQVNYCFALVSILFFYSSTKSVARGFENDNPQNSLLLKKDYYSDTVFNHLPDLFSTIQKITVLKELPPRIPTINYGARLPKTMHMLSNSTLQNREKIRILLFGQSIMAAPYVREAIEADLTSRFPNADLEIIHDAIGGYEAPFLVKTANHMIYPRYPDLVVMHCYGGEGGEFEQIIKDIQTYTTAEILTWTHHVDNFNAEKDEEREVASQLRRDLAKQYNLEIAEVREQWKKYLEMHNLSRGDLLVDNIHHNQHGGNLLGALLTRYFEDPVADPSTWQDKIRNVQLPQLSNLGDVLQGNWQTDNNGYKSNDTDAKLVYAFDGNRIDIGTMPIAENLGKATILIDGKKPSDHIGTWAVSLPSRLNNYNRPGIMKVDLVGLPEQNDTWTLTVTEVSADGRTFNYNVKSAVDGPQGSGNQSSTFISKNSLISIKPENFSFWHAASIGRLPAAPFDVTWEVYNDGSDIWEPAKRTDGNVVDRYILAKGLTNSNHVLEIIPQGDGMLPIKEFVVHRPLLGRTNVSNIAPNISITAPSNNSEFLANTNVTIEATANDVDGTVNKVDFYANNVKIGEDTQAPFSINWSAAAGNYELSAIAIDNGNLQTKSQIVNVNLTEESNEPVEILLEAENNFNVVSEEGESIVSNVAASDASGGNVVTIFDIGDKISIPFSINETLPIIAKLEVGLRSGNQNIPDNFWPNGYEFSINGKEIFLLGKQSTISGASNNLGGAYWGIMESGELLIDSENNLLEITSLKNWGAVDYLKITIIDSETNLDVLPTIDAGQDVTISLPDNTVQLIGSGNDADGGDVTMSWVQVYGAGGLTINVINEETLKIDDLQEGKYGFRFSVTDNEGNVVTDDVVVTVEKEDAQPTSNAGADKEVSLSSTSFVLEGSGSDPDGGEVTYLWSQVSGPNTATLSGATSASLTVSGIAEGIYVFSLQVTDDEGNTVSDEVSITVSKEDIKPTVDVSADQEVFLSSSSSFVLEGSGSDPDGGEITLLWRQSSGPNSAALSGTAKEILTVSNIVEGQYMFELQVTDDEGNSVSDSVSVTVINDVVSNEFPSVNVSFPQNNATFQEGISITITADASDADGSVSEVRFYVNDTLKSTVETVPFRYIWENVYIGNHTIWVEAYDDLGEKTTSESIQISVVDANPLSLHKNGETSLIAFPNPFNSILNLEVGALPGQQQVQFRLISVDGSIVDSFSKKILPNKPISFDLNRLSNGIYYLSFKLGDKVYRLKTVKI